jgi:hypothetical protein
VPLLCDFPRLRCIESILQKQKLLIEMIYGGAPSGNVRLLARVHDRRTIGVIKLLSAMPAIGEGASYPDGPYCIEAVGILDDLGFERRRRAGDTRALES